jgi:hypothetical protein
VAKKDKALVRIELAEEQKSLLDMSTEDLLLNLDEETAARELYRRAHNNLVKKQQS